MKNREKSRDKRAKVPAATTTSTLEPIIHVWLAGLGAASKAQSKGRRWLLELIREGARLEALERKAAKRAIRSTVSGVQDLVRRAVDELPPVQVLKEIRALREQVAVLNAKIDKLTGARGSARASRRALPSGRSVDKR